MFSRLLGRCIARSFSLVARFIGSQQMVLLTWLSKIILDLLSITVLGSPHGSYLLLYTSPTIVLYSVCMLVLFSRMRLQRCVLRFVKFFAPVTFGVYLFSEEPLIREAFITDSFSFLANFNPGV